MEDVESHFYFVENTQEKKKKRKKKRDAWPT